MLTVVVWWPVGSDNGLSPARRPVIIWTNAGILLTLNVRGSSYLGLTRSISWLPMPWLRHQQPWYWSCRISRALSYSRRNFNYLCLIRNDITCKYMFMFSLKKSSLTGLIGPVGTNFSENWIAIENFSIKEMHLKMPSAKWRLFGLGLDELTHWGRDKMDAVFQTTFSNGFSWMKIYEFRLSFHWSLFLRVQLTIHYLNQHWFVYWRIYASLGINELTQIWQYHNHVPRMTTPEFAYRFIQHLTQWLLMLRRHKYHQQPRYKYINLLFATEYSDITLQHQTGPIYALLFGQYSLRSIG